MDISPEESAAIITVAGKFAIAKTTPSPAYPDPPTQNELMNAFVDAYAELSEFLLND